MPVPREEHRVGLQALEAATALLRRVRRAHPTHGLYEAADLQWWWRVPRPTDDLAQLFWFDRDGRPEAAVIATDWGDSVVGSRRSSCRVPPLLGWPRSSRGLAHAAASGFGRVEVEVDCADAVTRGVLAGHGFERKEDGVVETWLDATARPDVTALPEGYRLARRLDLTPRPHHMIDRSGPAVETRLRETSLYRPDLDLAVLDRRDTVAAYGLFWYDPETATGLVEPMRTEDAHHRRGLARYVLTAGIDRLAAAGAVRVKICFRPDNPASRGLYLGVGFEPDRRTDVYAGRASESRYAE